MTSFQSVSLKDNWYPARPNGGSAVIGGWLIAAAVALVLYGLGAAIGVTAIDLSNTNGLTEKNALLTIIWVLVTWGIALNMGGYFAASFAHSDTSCCGDKKAVAVWALSIVMTAVLGTLGLGAAGLTGVAVAAKAGPALAQAADSMKEEYENIPLGYQASLMQQLSSAQRVNLPTAERLKASVVGMAAAKLAMGNEEDAKSYLELNSSLSREEIDTAVSKLSSDTEEAKAKLKAAADKAAKYTACAFWSMFLISVLSLFSAIMGARTAVRHRVENECKATPATV